ncbi:MAG: DNA repair protein RadC [Clostridia bacterium]|nr:DNA repair protein RadC [Clostridia bacterium]
MSVHDGHRQRMIQRFLQEGLDGFEEHQILEMLLFYSIPRRDTNETAHRLIDAFGSLSGVLDAPYQELLNVTGIGENTAAMLKLLPALTRVYQSAAVKDIRINSSAAAGEYLLPRFIGRRDEAVFLVCLDVKGQVLSCNLLHEGSVNSAEVNIRKIMSTVLKYNAVNVILAHNHPGGVALPSDEDLATTRRIRDALAPMDVTLVDHIIVAGGDYVSLADSGFLR